MAAAAPPIETPVLAVTEGEVDTSKPLCRTAVIVFSISRKDGSPLVAPTDAPASGKAASRSARAAEVIRAADEQTRFINAQGLRFRVELASNSYAAQVSSWFSQAWGPAAGGFPGVLAKDRAEDEKAGDLRRPAGKMVTDNRFRFRIEGLEPASDYSARVTCVSAGGTSTPLCINFRTLSEEQEAEAEAARAEARADKLRRSRETATKTQARVRADWEKEEAARMRSVAEAIEAGASASASSAAGADAPARRVLTPAERAAAKRVAELEAELAAVRVREEALTAKAASAARSEEEAAAAKAEAEAERARAAELERRCEAVTEAAAAAQKEAEANTAAIAKLEKQMADAHKATASSDEQNALRQAALDELLQQVRARTSLSESLDEASPNARLEEELCASGFRRSNVRFYMVTFSDHKPSLLKLLGKHAALADAGYSDDMIREAQMEASARLREESARAEAGAVAGAETLPTDDPEAHSARIVELLDEAVARVRAHREQADAALKALGISA